MPDFEVISGTQFCSLDADGCVTDGPGIYGVRDRCTIRVLTACLTDGWLEATEFDVQKRYAWERGEDSVTITGGAQVEAQQGKFVNVHNL